MRYVTTFNANPRYYRHVPILIDHIKNYLKEDISMLFIDDSEFLDEGLTDLWNMIQPFIDDHTITVLPAPPGFNIKDLTQLSRFWFAGNFPDCEEVTIIDIDMYPIEKSHFVLHDYGYHHFNYVRHANNLIPACYHSASSALFKKIYNKDNLPLDKFMDYAFKVTVSNGLNFDECYSTAKFDAYRVLHPKLQMWYKTIDTAVERFDTVFATVNKNWRKLNLRRIVDFHAPRSFSVDEIKEALDLIKRSK